MAKKKGLFAKKEKMKYYSLDNIIKQNAVYNIVIGERSNGRRMLRSSTLLTNILMAMAVS